MPGRAWITVGQRRVQLVWTVSSLVNSPPVARFGGRALFRQLRQTQMNGSIIAISRRGTAIDLTQGRLMFLVDTMGEPMFQFHPYQVQLLVPARTAVDMALSATVSRERPPAR